MKNGHITGYPAFLLLVLLLAVIIASTTSGCRTGQLCKIDNKGTLYYTQTTTQSPTVNSKETPFDLFRGLGQGSAVSAAPGGTATQSGSQTQDNAGTQKQKDLTTESTESTEPGGRQAPAQSAIALPQSANSASPTGLTPAEPIVPAATPAASSVK